MSPITIAPGTPSGLSQDAGVTNDQYTGTKE